MMAAAEKSDDNNTHTKSVFTQISENDKPQLCHLQGYSRDLEAYKATLKSATKEELAIEVKYINSMIYIIDGLQESLQRNFLPPINISSSQEMALFKVVQQMALFHQNRSPEQAKTTIHCVDTALLKTKNNSVFKWFKPVAKIVVGVVIALLGVAIFVHSFTLGSAVSLAVFLASASFISSAVKDIYKHKSDDEQLANLMEIYDIINELPDQIPSKKPEEPDGGGPHP